MTTSAELSYLNEMKDIDFGGDDSMLAFPETPLGEPSASGGAPFFHVAFGTQQQHADTAPPTAAQQQLQRPPLPPSSRESTNEANPSEEVVSPGKYQEVLESRFMDLRKLYYHTKEQRVAAKARARSLEHTVGDRDREIAELRAEVQRLQASEAAAVAAATAAEAAAAAAAASAAAAATSGRRSSSSSARPVLSTLQGNTPPLPGAKAAGDSRASIAACRALQQENAQIKEKLRTLQEWAASIRPPPVSAMH